MAEIFFPLRELRMEAPCPRSACLPEPPPTINIGIAPRQNVLEARKAQHGTTGLYL